MKKIFFLLCLSINLYAESKLIPRHELFGTASFNNPSISPDGTKIAYVSPYNGTPNIWLKTLDKNDAHPITFDNNRGINSYAWTYNNKYIVYSQDRNGKENWQLWKVNLKTNAASSLTPPNQRSHILSYTKENPDKMLILASSPHGFNVQILNLTSGVIKTIVVNTGDFQEFFADKKLQVRGAIRTLPDGGKEFLIRKNNICPWKTCIQWDLDDSLSSFPCAFHKDNKTLYLIDSRNKDKSCLAKINTETNRYECLLEDQTYDVAIPWINPGPFLHPDTDELIAMPIIKERKEWVLFDKNHEADFTALETFSQDDFSILSYSQDFSKWLVAYFSDIHPPYFYLYDRDSKTAQFLFSSHPELEKYQLQQTQPFSFQSRDGLTIHGYITYPDTPNKKNLPLLIDVHGGPWERNRWGFCAEAQFFANRGYAYMQVNFRGSTSYGKKFLNAGNKEWGQGMHNDIVDATQWAVQQEIANPQKIAVAGFSYGGYEALWAATQNPDLFKCAISLSGISNLQTLIRNWPAYATAAKIIFKKRIGDLATERNLLQERSPLTYAHQIKIPVLIGTGENDVRVTPVEAIQIINELQAHGVEHEYHVYPNEGHGLSKEENRIKWVTSFECFLAKHLGGRCEKDYSKKSAAPFAQPKVADSHHKRVFTKWI
jgi:protease II